ncbi:MAG: HEPN domain-containing protein [Candidatus Omnitrophica bacterium]|nr:HEPN domain-containing protein [Candidatus Omnitrophota bacterium]
MMQNFQEWITQADYDYETAKYMAQGQRYIYAVFMCHLAIEKILKGMITRLIKEQPPRTHSLIQLANKAQINPPENIGKFLVFLDQASIPTRYPENLHKLQAIYSEEKTLQIINNTQDVLEWIKQTF